MAKVPSVVIVETENGPVRMNRSKYERNPEAYTLAETPGGGFELKGGGGSGGSELKGGGGSGGSDIVTVNPPASETVTVETPATPASETPAQTPTTYLVSKEGKKFFVVNSAGDKVESDKIDAGGYSKEADAWDAIIALQASDAPAG